MMFIGIIKENELVLRVTFNSSMNRYMGRITNYNIISIIDSHITKTSYKFYGDTINEVLDQFYEFANKINIAELDD